MHLMHHAVSLASQPISLACCSAPPKHTHAFAEQLANCHPRTFALPVTSREAAFNPATVAVPAVAVRSPVTTAEPVCNAPLLSWPVTDRPPFTTRPWLDAAPAFRDRPCACRGVVQWQAGPAGQHMQVQCVSCKHDPLQRCRNACISCHAPNQPPAGPAPQLTCSCCVLPPSIVVLPSTVAPPLASRPPLAVSWPEMVTGWAVSRAREPAAASSVRAGPSEVRLMVVAPSRLLPVTTREARVAALLVDRAARDVPPVTLRAARELSPVTCIT